MSPLDTIRDELTQEVGRTRALVRGIQLVQREEEAKACQSDDLAYLLELAEGHVNRADRLTVRLEEAITALKRGDTAL